MSAETGLNQSAAEAAILNIIEGGAEVRLMVDAPSYDDGDADIGSKEVGGASYDSVAVPEGEWSITPNASESHTRLSNDGQVDFGQAQEDWGVVTHIVIQDPGTDLFIRSDEINDPEITEGEYVSFPAGELVYEIGGGN